MAAKNTKSSKPSKSEDEIKRIKEITKILVDKKLKEIHVEDEKTSIRVVAHGDTSAVGSAPMVMPTPAPMVTASPSPASPAATATDSNTRGTPVTSPIVGTAYLSPSPDASVFVNVGQEVKVGQTIMIVEAMKNMNEIQSTANGKIIEICVDDGQPVEFGETLIIVE